MLKYFLLYFLLQSSMSLAVLKEKLLIDSHIVQIHYHKATKQYFVLCVEKRGLQGIAATPITADTILFMFKGKCYSYSENQNSHR